MFPEWLNAIRLRLKAMFHRRRLEQDLDDEMQFHLAMSARKLIEQGMPPEKARYAARRQFGNPTQTKETSRDMWTFPFLETLWQDLRYGLRQLRRNPGFTVVAVLTLALGIGAGTVIFSLFDAVFLRPLSVRDPEQLVRAMQDIPKIGSVSDFRYAYIRALSDRAKSFEFVFGQTGQNYHLAMRDSGAAQDITLRAVTSEFFEALGIPALYGRVLTPADATQEPGSPPAVLSYAFWKRDFAGNPRVINGRTIIVGGHHFAVVGVMPRDFGGLSVDTAPDLWIPLRAFPPLVSETMDNLLFDLALRLKPGVRLATAQAECRAIWTPAMKDYLKRDSPKMSARAITQFILSRRLWLEPLEHGASLVRQRYGGVFKLLMASISLLFLIVCANIAGLLLARYAARNQEVALRLAIGATRWRLVRQMLTESLLLAALGAGGGLLIARAAMPFAARQLPPIHDVMGWPVPVSLNAHINTTVFLFSLALATLATLLFSLAPAVANGRTPLDTVLRGSHSSARLHGRQTLILLQTAMCLILLTAAGLFVRTFRKLARTEPGFNPSHVATFTEDLTGQQVPPELLKTLRRRVRGLPGVVSDATALIGVMRGHGLVAGLAPAGQPMTSANWLNANVNNVSPGYFRTMGMQILEGRGFTSADEQEKKTTGPEKAVVSATLAKKFFPNTDPIGKLFGSGILVAYPDYQVIGVVNDIKYRSLREPIRPELYVLQKDAHFFVLYVRTRMPADAIILPVQKVLASIDPSLPIGLSDTLSAEVHNSIDGERETAALASVFGIAAALLVCLGIYGLLAYSVAQRQREIGIRMALGAEKRDVLRMVVWQGLKLTLIGVAIGIAGVLALTRFLSSLLYGVTPTDPLTLIAVSLILVAVALVACYVPARRASKIDPMEALRYE